MPSTPILSVAQLKLFPDQDRSTLLATSPEDQWLERKSGQVQSRDVANVMIGMANAEGGIIVIGVTDAGVIEGVAAGDQNAWRRASPDFTVPPVRHHYSVFPCVTAKGPVGELVVIEIEASETVHQNVRGDVYLRVGDSTRQLRPFEAQELQYDKGQSVFDARPVPEATMDDLDPSLLERYMRRVRARAAAIEVLDARGLALRSGEQQVPTVAGIAVLGRNPQRFFPEAFVRVVEYRDAERTFGSSANVLHDWRFEGPLTHQIDGARRYLKRRLPSVIRLGPAARFSPQSLLPDEVWTEALVNAVVHRSYTMSGDHVRVEVFPDRLEVESPGRLPGLVRVENIRSTRFARNPRIARAIADLGYGRELGEGVDRMFEEMKRAGLPDPVFQQLPASVRVTLRFDTLAGRLLAGLSPALQRLFELIQQGGQVTTAELTERLGRSRPTVLSGLRQLVAEGLVEHAGSSLNDPRGYWRPATAPPSISTKA